jgi:hypothetical protein
MTENSNNSLQTGWLQMNVIDTIQPNEYDQYNTYYATNNKKG